MPEVSKKILVVVGPTASGKSDLAIALAKKYDGEIVSVDSRQVYRGMDIGTGKIPRDRGTRMSDKDSRSQKSPTREPVNSLTPYYSSGIPHYLLDIASPKIEYNISHFLKDASQAIEDIRSRGKTPILCGGTTFWIEALVFGLSLPQVKPDKAFRERWEKKDAGELYGYLKRLDPERAKSIDRHNKVRLLRAIEIARALGKVPPLSTAYNLSPITYLFIGLNPLVEELNQKIRERLKTRLKAGMIDEVKKLRASGVSWDRLESFGLEYRAVALHLQGKLTREELESTLPYDIIHYAKRQRSSLRRLEKRGLNIQWFKHIDEALADFHSENL